MTKSLSPRFHVRQHEFQCGKEKNKIGKAQLPNKFQSIVEGISRINTRFTEILFEIEIEFPIPPR